jgi:hypothetical protein
VVPSLWIFDLCTHHTTADFTKTILHPDATDRHGALKRVDLCTASPNQKSTCLVAILLWMIIHIVENDKVVTDDKDELSEDLHVDQSRHCKGKMTLEQLTFSLLIA